MGYIHIYAFYWIHTWIFNQLWLYDAVSLLERLVYWVYLYFVLLSRTNWKIEEGLRSTLFKLEIEIIEKYEGF